MLSRIRAASTAALECGALLPFDTEYELVSHMCHPVKNGFQPKDVKFIVRVVKNLARKDAAGVPQPDPVAPAPQRRPHDFNPFLPYEKAMYVQSIPPAHVLLLNKFNVVQNHVLIVTEKFEDQSSLLRPVDFSALFQCLSEMDGLAFYNAGKVAGASQRHKHLQLIPTPFAEGQSTTQTPFDSLYTAVVSPGNIYSSPYLPFIHAVVRVGDIWSLSATEAGEQLMQLYLGLLKTVHEEVRALGEEVDGWHANDIQSNLEGVSQPFSYNLLATRNFLIVIPRRHECFSGEFAGEISINAMAFVGCMLVRDKSQLEVIRKDPMKALQHTGFPRTLDKRACSSTWLK